MKTQYAMRSEKYAGLKKHFTGAEIDCIMQELIRQTKTAEYKKIKKALDKKRIM